MFKICLFVLLAGVSASSTLRGSSPRRLVEAETGCREMALTSTFHYFNSGSATGCEHRHHYLYDYRGSDCVWESSPTVINQRNLYDFQWMRAKFTIAEYGTMEYSDFVEVTLAACTTSSSSSCGSYATTKLLRDDFGGWYWQLQNGYWLSQLNPNHSHIRVKITLHSTSDYSERHILDNLEINGWGCEKPEPTAEPTTRPTAVPTKAPTVHNCDSGAHYCWQDDTGYATASCIKNRGGHEYSCECPAGYATLRGHISHWYGSVGYRHNCQKTASPTTFPTTSSPTPTPAASWNVVRRTSCKQRTWLGKGVTLNQCQERAMRNNACMSPKTIIYEGGGHKKCQCASVPCVQKANRWRHLYVQTTPANGD